jgi:DNA (cytosine-5)-methyltransferase 1
MLTFLSIADKLRPKWLVWENVPGVLSSNGGKDFGTFLGALGELGYGFAYRVLDAQYFGVAQRRRRVFVVGYLGDWRVAAAVLFERESLQGNTKPSRKKREEVTSDAEGSVGEAGDAQPIAVDTYNQTISEHTTQTIRSQFDTDHIGAVLQPIPINTMTMLGRPSDDKNPRMGLGIGNPGEPQNTLTKTHSHAVAQPMAFDWQSGGDMRGMNLQEKTQLQRCQTPAVMHSMSIRRLTPKECERLQGFPDDWTKIPYRNKEADQCPDGPRYKACGNSMAVPVMRWIGERINLIESML